MDGTAKGRHPPPPAQEVISKLREREWDRENGTEMSKGALALGPPVLVSSVLGT